MTTLIDRITKRIDELKKSTCTKSIVDELERVKAELTAVNGVDDVCTACYGKGKYSVYEGDQVLEPDFCGDKPLLYKKGGIKEYLCPKCGGKSEQSQAEKVVEIKYVIRKCICKTTLGLSDNYCPNCGAKIKWIA